MTELGRGDFEEFFAAVNGGHRPFSWQVELLDLLCETGRWPDVISAPTGAGKSSAVDIHVFANALSALGGTPRVPRRLGVVVNRRGLVDSHAQHAEAIRAALASEDGVVGAVAAALARLSLQAEPLGLASLRGGMATDSSWLDDPGACSVISATPDMWGSRLLFRGYGSTRHAWPREAGLLGFDSVLLLDESHLNRQLLQTASDAAWITARSEHRLGVPGLQVTAMTATPAPPDAAAVIVGVDPTRLDNPRDDALRLRLTRPKTVEYLAVPSWPTRAGPASAVYIEALAQAAREARTRVCPADEVAGTVGCFVNRVDTAVRLAELLAREVGQDGVACWVGRMRPMDLDELRARNPGLFTVRGDNRVAYLVATQTVEVGVDIDLAGLVTELAGGSALAQRFGRVNRLGLRPVSHVQVVGPLEVAGDALPYLEADLAEAQAWVLRREQTGGIAPVEISSDPAPIPAMSRLALSDLTSGHAQFLAHTSNELFAEPDLTFWLRDDLEPDTEPVSFVVRADLPTEDDSSAIAMLEATAPTIAEAFPARIGDARKVVSTILEPEPREGEPPARCFRWRDRVVEQLADASTIKPGDVLIVDEGHRLTRRRVIVADAEAVERFPLGLGEGVIDVVTRGRAQAGDDLLDALGDAPSEDVQGTFERLQDRLVMETSAQVVTPVPDSESHTLPWAVVLASDSLPGEAEIRQEWTANRAAVSLGDHQQAVADQALQIADRIGLAKDAADALVSAGLHHDDGKTDTRFQLEVLGAAPGVLLAKSAGGAQQARRRRMGSGLPLGWRHEQLSAALVWARADEFMDMPLVTRLVGTSHGRGRPFFPHGAHSDDEGTPAGGLLSGSEPQEVRASAFALFETGAGWDDVLVGTADRLGEWGCAYLEALLRAADCTVSKAGS